MSVIRRAIQTANNWRRIGKTKAAVLMYHRVAEPKLDPWGLSVTPQHFAEHLDIIGQHAQPMSFQSLAAAHKTGNIPERAVVITFDDGYVDNLRYAKPLLEQYNIPATVFITTGNIGTNREFWWDELERVLLQPGTLPQILRLKIDGKDRQWQLGKAANYSQDDYQSDRHLRAWDGQPNSRLALYYSVWDTLRKLTTQERQPLLNEIIDWANTTTQARDEYRSLTQEELQELDHSEMVEIGAHTITHPSLPAHNPEIQRHEIQTSKEWLEKVLHHPISSFSYPFGDFDRNSVHAVKEYGFEQACTTDQQSVWQGSDRFLLPRFEVLDWEKQTFRAKLMDWIS